MGVKKKGGLRMGKDDEVQMFRGLLTAQDEVLIDSAGTATAAT